MSTTGRISRIAVLLVLGSAFASEARSGDTPDAAPSGPGVRSASNQEAARERFYRSAWSTVTTLDAVPAEALASLRSRLGDDTRIADRGQPFGATDAVSGLPSRRLVLAGQSTSDWFLVYEQGGRGHHLVFVMFENRDVARPVLLASGTAGTHDDVLGWQLGVGELVKGLKFGTMTWRDADAKTY